MKISELKNLSKQLVAIVLTVALVLTLAPAGIQVAEAAGEATVKSVELVNPQNDPGAYTFYKDFNQYDYIATGSRIKVTYGVDGGQDYEEIYYVDWTSNASEEGDYNDEAECFETYVYNLDEEASDYIMIRYQQETNTVYAHIPEEDDDESGVDFDLYQPIYKELSEMPTVSLGEKKNIENCGYTQYYRLNDMNGICADINTEDLTEAKIEDDPGLELYEKVQGAELWRSAQFGEDQDVLGGDYNDRLVYSLREDAEYVLAVYNAAFEDQVYYIGESPYAQFSVAQFVPATDYQVKVRDNYLVYPQLGVYPYQYDLTKADNTTETVYGTGSEVKLKDGYVRNNGTASRYTGLDGSVFNATVDSSKIKTVSFTELTGEEYKANTSVTVPAKTQKLVYMNYDSASEYNLSITGGDEDTFISYANESMAQTNVYGYATSGTLYQLSYYPAKLCYVMLLNYSDHDATYTISGQDMGSEKPPVTTDSGSKGNQGTTAVKPASQPKSTAKPQVKCPLIKGKTVTVKKIKYKAISEKTVAVVGTTSAKKLKKVTIPATVKVKGVSCKVTTINANAFKNCKKLKTVKLGKNVNRIKGNAFKKCKKLKKVTLTAKKKVKIDKKAFQGCGKVTFKVKKSLKKSYKKAIKKAKIGCKYSVK